MDEPIKHPTWSDINIPEALVAYVRRLGSGTVLDYLVLNRIYRFNIKAQYVYTCHNCGFQKRISRNYESYLRCDQCSSGLISSVANWRMGKDRVEGYTRKPGDGMLRKTIRQMTTIYTQYFRRYPTDDFLKCDLMVGQPAVEMPDKDGNWPHPAPDALDLHSDMPQFSAQFCCGEQVVGNNQQTCIYQAAILCPFLWDDSFDWKYMVPKDRGREVHILPMLNLWCKLKDGRKGSRWVPDGHPPQFDFHENHPPLRAVYPGDEGQDHPVDEEQAPVDEEQAPPQQDQGDVGNGPNFVPAAVLEALAEEPNILDEMFQ